MDITRIVKSYQKEIGTIFYNVSVECLQLSQT